MENRTLWHLRPTLAMLGADLALAGVPCRVRRGDDETRFRAIRLYTRGMELAEDVLYVL